ncbi:MAG: Fic family protein, partial [Myxococcales bacterium]
KAGKPQAKVGQKPKPGVSKQKPTQGHGKPAAERSRANQRKEQKLSRKPSQKAPAKVRIPEKKTREAAKKLEQQQREREAKLKAEQKRKEAAQRKKDQELLAQQKRKASEAKKKELERRAEQKRKDAERHRAALEAQKKREAEQKAREQEKARVAAEKAAAKEAQRKAAEDEKLRRVQEREASRIAKEQERAQQKAQREAEREEARRAKEEERAKRDAEREAYRKAKEAEREKIRAAKEAARRALEGRIAEQNRNANKLGGGRSSTTRIYSPKAIPDQSGTTRRVLTPLQPQSAAGVSESEAPAALDAESEIPGPTPTPLPPALASESPSKPPPAEGSVTAEEEAARAAERAQPIPENVEDRYRVIEERLKAAPDNFNRDYKETIDMSWIHHDSALEGVVYTFQELKSALDPANATITDSSLQPVVEEIRRHKQAIDLVRDLGERKRAPITVDTIKKIYVTLHPEEGDIKTVKYRRDIPQHRLYFHEYAHPEKITYKVRQVVDWFNGPEPKKLKSPIRVAARVHYELLRIFPFQTDSGKVARLMMNLILMRAGHPPAIIHSTERQRYYEALKGALPVLVQMVTESIMNSLMSIEKLLDDHDIRLRA